MKNFEYDFDIAYEELIETAQRYGIEVTPAKDGKGGIYLDGKPMTGEDIIKGLDKAFAFNLIKEKWNESEKLENKNNESN